NSGDTKFTVDASDLVAGGSVIGGGGNDTLTVVGTAFDLTGTTLTGVEILKTSTSLATTFTVDQADLVAGGSVVGSSGIDTLLIAGTAIDLGNTTLSSVEVLKTLTSQATTFTVSQTALSAGG